MATSISFDILARDHASTTFLRVASAAEIAKGSFGDAGSAASGLAKAIGGAGLIPVAAAASAVLVELSTSAAAGGLALGAFGISAAGILVGMKNAQTQIKATDLALSKLTPGTTAYRTEAAKLKDEQFAFNKSFGPAAKGYNDMTNSFTRFKDATSHVTLGVLHQGFELIAKVLPKLVPVSNAAGKALGGLLTDLSNWTESRSFTKVLHWLETSGPKAITAFGHSIGNVIVGLGGILSNFVGPGNKAAHTMEELTARFADWGNSKGVSDSVDKFLKYVSANGGKITSVLESLAQTVPKLAIALGGLGATNLSAVGLFLNLIAGMNQTTFNVLAKGLFAVYVATKAWTLATAGGNIVQAISVARIKALTVVTGQNTAVTKGAAAASKDSAAATEAQAGATQGLSKSMATLRFGAAIGGMVALTYAAKASNDKLKILAGVGGGAMLGFAAGGPIGAAIGAGAGAIYALTQNIGDAAAVAKGSRADFAGLGDTLDTLTGAVTADTRKFIENKLVRDGTIKSLAAYGITTRTAISAILGEGNARRVVTAAIKGQEEHYKGLLGQIRQITAANVADEKAGTLTPQAQAARKQQIDALRAQAAAEKQVIASVRNGIGVTRQQIRLKREDIAATADYSGKLKGLPKNVKTFVSAHGIIPTTKGIADITHRFHLVPKQVKTLIAAAGVDTSIKAVERIRSKLQEVSKTKADLSAYQQSLRAGSHSAEAASREMGLAVRHKAEEEPKKAKVDFSTYLASIRNANTQAQGIASSGGHEVGAALSSGVLSGFSPTASRLSAAAAGAVTQAIAAARHAAQAHSPSRKMVALGHDLMDGLLHGIADRQMTVQKAMERVQGVIDKVGTKIANLMSTKSGFLKTFTPETIFGTDLSTTVTDALGNSTTTSPNVSDLLAFQEAQRAKARQLAHDVRAVTKMGLSKSLVRELEASGASGAASLHALAMGNSASISHLNRLDKQTSDSLRSAGMRAGNYVRGGSINDDIRRARRQEHLLESLDHHLKDLVEGQKKGQTIIVKVGEDALVKAVYRYEHRKGKKTLSN